MLKTVLNSDDEYKKLMGRCNHGTVNIEDNMYQIDTKGFLRFKNLIYVPNHSNIKHIILRELHNNPYARHPRYQKFITTLKKYFY